MVLFYGDNINYSFNAWERYSFGESLRKIRRHEKMTMSELANKSKVSQSYISQLENNVRLPSDKVIQDLALALAKGNTVNVVDPFGDPNKVLESYDSYSDEFEVEKRQQDIADLLTKIKEWDESKAKKKEYLNTVSTSEGESVTLSQIDLTYLKSINTLTDKQKQFVLDFIDFLIERKD